MVEASVRLNFEHMMDIYKSGYTRIPVYEREPQNIIGILYVKDLILLDPGMGLLNSLQFEFDRKYCTDPVQGHCRQECSMRSASLLCQGALSHLMPA